MAEHAMQQHHESARNAYETGRLRVAMSIIQECLHADSDDGRAWELSGLVHYSSGRYRQAVSSLERAQCLVPLRPAGKVCLGHGYRKTGLCDVSRDALLELIEDPTLSVPLLLQVGIGLNAVDRPDLAMSVCRKILDEDDQVAQAYYDLGFYASECGYSAGAVEFFARKAISLNPHSVQYRVGLTGLLYENGQLDDAYELIEEFSNDDIGTVNCVCCLRRLSNLYKRSSDYRRVVLCQQRLLQLGSTNEESGHP